MAVNYNNPQFEYIHTGSFSWTKGEAGAFIQDAWAFSDNPNAWYVRIAISSFSQYNFLLLINFIVNTSNGTRYFKDDTDFDYTWRLECGSNGAWSLSSDQGSGFVTAFDNIFVLSTCPRYFRFNESYITIKPSNFIEENTFEIVPSISMYYHVISTNQLYPGNVFYITPDDWAFEDTITQSTYDINEYPVYKNSNNDYYKRESTSVIGTPMKARHAFFLKTNGSNTTTVLHQRNFSQYASNASSEALNKTLVGAAVPDAQPDQPTSGGFMTHSRNNKIFTGKGTPVIVSADYPYYSRSFSNGDKVYPNLFEDNNAPTASNPIVIFSDIFINRSPLCKKDILINQGGVLVPYNPIIDLKNRLLWIDQYTLVFSYGAWKGVYYIPPTWKVGVSRITGWGGDQDSDWDLDSYVSSYSSGTTLFSAECFSYWHPSRDGHCDAVNIGCSVSHFTLTHNNTLQTSEDITTKTVTGQWHYYLTMPSNNPECATSYYAGLKGVTSRSFIGQNYPQSRTQQIWELRYTMKLPSFFSTAIPSDIHDSFTYTRLPHINDYTEGSGTYNSDEWHAYLSYHYKGGHIMFTSMRLNVKIPFIGFFARAHDAHPRRIDLQSSSATAYATSAEDWTTQSSINVSIETKGSIGYCIYLYK